MEATRDYCYGDKWQYSVELRQLLFALLCVDPTRRLTVHDMLAHQWFDDVIPREEASSSPRVRVTRSPTRSKLVRPSPSSFSEGSTHSHSQENTRRPHSAEDEQLYGSPHVSALLSAGSSSSRIDNSVSLAAPPRTPSAKVVLPSLSPEKPSGSRSPDKSFGKRNPSPVTHMPSTAASHDHSTTVGASNSSTGSSHQRSSRHDEHHSS